MTAPPGLSLRAAEVGDAAALCALANLPGYRHGTLRLPYQGLAQTRRLLEGLSEADLFLAAELDGQLVASGSLHRQGGRRHHAAALGIGVHDAWTGRGIGTALLAALLETADDWLGLRRIELTVYADNARAIALYERFGFAREGLMRCHSFRAGRYVDTLAMARLRGLPEPE